MERSGSSSAWALLTAIRFATLEIKLDLLRRALERRYRPDQPRAPKGTPEGGRWIDTAGAVHTTRLEADRTRVAQVGGGTGGALIPVIPPDKMFHLINAHGFGTPRTNGNNSKFLPAYSTPQALTEIAIELYRLRKLSDPGHVGPWWDRDWRNGPWYGGLYQFTGELSQTDLQTGATMPEIVGIDSDGNLTNAVRIRFEPLTGIVHSVFPVPARW